MFATIRAAGPLSGRIDSSSFEADALSAGVSRGLGIWRDFGSRWGAKSVEADGLVS